MTCIRVLSAGIVLNCCGVKLLLNSVLTVLTASKNFFPLCCTVAVNMDPNIMLTIGAFVAAVAMACGVMLYRTWKSSVTYERMV